MKQFGKAVAAVLVGLVIHDVADMCFWKIDKHIRKKNEAGKVQYTNVHPMGKRVAYSPEVDGRRPIGFRASSEE